MSCAFSPHSSKKTDVSQHEESVPPVDGMHISSPMVCQTLHSFDLADPYVPEQAPSPEPADDQDMLVSTLMIFQVSTRG
jgi:hypothetical protein